MVLFDKSSGVTHLLNRAIAVTGMNIDRSHGFLDCHYFESFLERVEHGVLDAVVGCQATYNYTFHFLGPELRCKIGLVES
jgi:hypothetical protein